MSKIAFINIPAHGHTNPTLPVVRELLARGHQVLYYSSEEFRDKIAITGAEFHPYQGWMPTTQDVSQRMKSMIDASLMMIEMSETQTAWMIEEMQREQPDLIIYDTTSMWGYIAARVLDIPSICSVTHFLLEGSQRHLPKMTMLQYILSAIPKLPRIIQWKRTMNQQFGKENVGGITEYAERNIVFTSRDFHPDNDTIDEHFRFVGPSIDESMRETSDFRVTHQGKIVYISLGTINNLNTDFYRTAFSAFADYPAQFIMSVGKHTDIGALLPIPDNFAIHPYVPQLQVLQQADVFITHGGMNSVHEGLFYNVPLIVIPQQIEQLLNGIRVQEVGAGLLLGGSAPYGRVSASELCATLDKLLSNDSYRQQAAHYGKTLRDAGGYLRAVDEIETYLHQSSMVLQPA